MVDRSTQATKKTRNRRPPAWARPYIPNSTDRLALVSLDRPTAALWPIRLTQIIGGKTWSLSLVRYRSREPMLMPSNPAVREGEFGG